MLCYRCGSYNSDGTRKCSVCGQAFAAQRRSSKIPASPTGSAARQKTPFDPGTRIAGRYRVVSAVVQGTAGWVLRARDEEVDVDVAVKVIANNLLQTEEERGEFLRVVKAARKVAHPNIVRIYDEGRDERFVFYTMAYLEGLTLRKIIDLRLEKGQVFTIAETLPLFGQLAVGLDNLDKFPAHGSLGPTNITVLPDILKITGLPHLLGLPRRPFLAQQQQRQSLEYIAPEARREGSEIDHRADVYSLAVIFGEMLTGHVYGRDPLGWTRAQRQLPRKVAGLLGQALAERPEDRFDGPSAFFDAVAEAIADTQFDQAEPVPLGKSPKTPQQMANESTDTDGTDDPTRPKAYLPPTPSESAPGPIIAEPSASDVPAMGRPISVEPPARFAERRGKAEKPTQSRKASSSTFAYVLAGVVVVAVAAMGAAFWWKSQQNTMELQPVVDVTGSLPTVAAVEPKPTDGRGTQTGAKKPAVAVPKSVTVVETEKPRQKVEEKKPEAAEPKPEPKIEAKREPEKTPPPPPEPPELTPVKAVAADAACPEGMTEIDGAPFEFGSSPSDPMRGFGELAAKRTALEPYCIDVYEYPNQKGRVPTANYTWQKAKQACEKAGKRLCSEQEWELACKGTRNLRFPFGGEFSAGVCNIGANGRPAPAGEYSRCRSVYGVADMAGNLAEWTSSRFSDDVADKVVKGGAADQASYTGRCSARVNEAATGKGDTLGFRCCSTLKR